MPYGQETSSSPTFGWRYAEFNDSNFQIRGRTLFFVILLLSVMLLVALLFLYARWACRVAAPQTAARASTRVRRRRGLDAAEISGLPIVLHKIENGERSNTETAECCICLGVFDEGDEVKELPRCRHSFHSECVDTWLKAQSSCPLCRAAIMGDPPV